nr:unnamed protein product [Callosobruchus analis]
MILNKKEIAIICSTFVMCASTIISNTNLMLLEWKRRKHERNKLKMQLLLSKCLMNEALVKNRRQPTRSKNKKRSYDWWENIVNKEFSEQDWLENFRVGKDTFMFIVNELRVSLQPKGNILNSSRTISSVEKKVAIALFYLASVCEYRVVGHTFGIHKSTVHNIVHEFVNAVNKVLLHRFIKMPTEAEAIEVASYFQQTTVLPNIIGAIDGTHIPIKPPRQGHRDFINRKGWASVILQGVVDAKYRFMDICVKNPGATHDASVLTGSDLFRNVHTTMPKSSVQVGGRQVSYVLLGDAAYPLLPWLMKPYPSRHITPPQDSFNVYTSAGRVVVENAFGRLKARWRRLLKQCDVDHKFVPKLVAACCTLHNIIETHKGGFNMNWMQDVENAEIIFPQPHSTRATSSRDSFEAHNLREHLCNYLANNAPLRASRQII